MLSFLSSIWGKLVCLTYSFYLVLCLALVHSCECLVSVQVELICHPPPSDTGASKVQCFHPKCWAEHNSCQPFPGDKQLGEIIRRNHCLQECFLLRRKAKKACNSLGLLPGPRHWPSSAIVLFPKSSGTVYWHVLWGKQPDFRPPFIWSKP